MNAPVMDGDRVALMLLARLARVLTRPIACFHPSHYGDFDMEASDLATLAGHDAFAGPLEQVMFDRLGLARIKLSPAGLRDLTTCPERKLSLLIAAAEPEDLDTAARVLSAAILRQPLSGLIARADRDRAIAEFGSFAFQTAIREAATLYPDLQDLGDGSCFEMPVSGEVEIDRGAGPARQLGYSWLCRFVESSEPALSPLFAFRVPRDFVATGDNDRLGERCRSQFVSLLSRKIPGWSICTE